MARLAQLASGEVATYGGLLVLSVTLISGAMFALSGREVAIRLGMSSSFTGASFAADDRANYKADAPARSVAISFEGGVQAAAAQVVAASNVLSAVSGKIVEEIRRDEAARVQVVQAQIQSQQGSGFRLSDDTALSAQAPVLRAEMVREVVSAVQAPANAPSSALATAVATAVGSRQTVVASTAEAARVTGTPAATPAPGVTVTVTAAARVATAAGNLVFAFNTPTPTLVPTPVPGSAAAVASLTAVPTVPAALATAVASVLAPTAVVPTVVVPTVVVPTVAVATVLPASTGTALSATVVVTATIDAVTATPVAFTPTPEPPTATVVLPTDTPVLPTATPIPPTGTPVPPSATVVPATATPVPPTATAVPPTATSQPTSVPATSTPAPPTDTPTPTGPTATPTVAVLLDMSLTKTGTGTYTSIFGTTAAEVSPGQSTSRTLNVQNNGALPFTYQVGTSGGSGPLWTDTTSGLKLQITRNGVIVYDGPLNTPGVTVGTVAVGAQDVVVFNVYLPAGTTADNTMQGATTTINFDFLAQSTP